MARYFSKPEFIADPDGRLVIAEHADRAVRDARQMGVELDWTEESVREVARALGSLHEQHAAGLVSAQGARRWADGFGAYVGEVFRRHHGGTWGVCRVYTEAVPALSVGTAGIEFLPWSRVLGRITRGEAEDVWAYYRAARETVMSGAASINRVRFEDDPGIAEQMRAAASEAVSWAARECGVTLDGGQASVAALDAVLEGAVEELDGQGFRRDRAWARATQFGASLGEVFRATHGGTWVAARLFRERVPVIRSPLYDYVFWPLLDAFACLTGVRAGVSAEYELASAKASGRAPVESYESAAGARAHYRIGHDQGYFDVGVAGDGRQVIFDGTGAVLFDADGGLLGHRKIVLPVPYPTPGASDYVAQRAAWDAAVERAKAEFRQELALESKPINVRKFAAEALGVGIEDHPFHFRSFLESPLFPELDEEERRETERSILDWGRRGCFVLYWGNDLWLNGAGEVEST